jgi:hypothetical protein
MRAFYLLPLLPFIGGCVATLPEAPAGPPLGGEPPQAQAPASALFGLDFVVEADRPFCVHELAWQIDGVATRAPASAYRQFCTQPERQQGRLVHVARLSTGMPMRDSISTFTVFFKYHPAAPLRRADFSLGGQFNRKPNWRTSALTVTVGREDVVLDRLDVRQGRNAKVRHAVTERIDRQGTVRAE